jgi:tetratricopeptide (TPR) repeat protein
MFKRFQAAKPHPPFPPIEEDIRCPQCGFNHAGWAFEPGYAKLCVKCGQILEAAASPDLTEERDDTDAGFFGRLFSSLFGKKGAEPEEVPVRVEPDPFPQDLGTSGEFLGDPEGFPDAVEASQEENEGTDTPEERGHEPGDLWEPVEQYDALGDPEAAHIGACKKEGRLLAAEGRYQEAIELLRKVIEFEPNDLEAWGELGRFYYKGPGDLAKSIECSRKALAIDDDLVWANCNLCLALLFDGQFEPAKEGFMEVIRSVRDSRRYDKEFQENCKALLHDCLGELYSSKKEASAILLDHINEIIELLEIEKIYFH